MVRRRGRENGGSNPSVFAQQLEKVHVVEEPLKEASKSMNDTVNNVEEELIKVNLNEGGEERLVKISKNLSEEEKRKLIALLKEYKDVFA